MAFARSQSGRGTRSGKSVRAPVVESGNVSDWTVTMISSSGSVSPLVAPSTTMSASVVAATR